MKVSVFRKGVIYWSVSQACSQRSLEFIKAVAGVRVGWSGGLEGAVQTEKPCAVFALLCRLRQLM